MKAALGAGLVVILLAAGGLLFIHTHERCSLGYAGSAMSITLEGAGAEGYCQQAVQNGRNALYRIDGAPAGASICSYQKDGYTITVHDTGLNLLGSAACSSVAGGPGVRPAGY